ncbi:MarR family winged helix-turn-helix transcriptional regulator [uncultured Amphritea sp.]|uniref:MarR family winged helix-turn-helix transcriptional regulator n=1 Tax=uncultured Amphritea sp. TaxID=981605 RepID=UPI00261D5E11|nr:MarR family winged helix-turn-helix transcriptional regulator [uncultured Amphritea sp.]
MKDKYQSPLDLEQMLAARLTRISSTLDHFGNYYYSEVFPETNLNDARYLLILGARKEASAVDIVKAMNFDKATASRNIKKLIDQGLILRKTDPSDARRNTLTLSKKGQAIYDEISQSVRLRNEAALASLSPGEVTIFFEILDKLQASANNRLQKMNSDKQDPAIDYTTSTIIQL